MICLQMLVVQIGLGPGWFVISLPKIALALKVTTDTFPSFTKR